LTTLSEKPNPYTSTSRAARQAPISGWEGVAERNKGILGQGAEKDVAEGIAEIGHRNDR